MLSRFLISLLAALLISCTENGSEKIFDNYLYRLGNSLDLPSDLSGSLPKLTKTLPRSPTKKTLAQDIASSNINLIEFLKLSSCELQRHIGQRNSSLGQVMPSSQKLIYEYEFLRLAKLCLDSLSTDDALYNTLNDVIRQKKAELDKVKANAVFASDEWQTLFSLSSHALSPEEIQIPAQPLLAAINNIERYVNQLPSNSTGIEDEYAVLGASKYVGELRLSIQMAQHYLQQADQYLNYRIQQKPLCINNQANTDFDVVNTVFRKFYIGEIQPYLAKLHQQSEAIFSQLDLLISTVAAPEELITFWEGIHQEDNSEWANFNAQIETHTRHWQQLLSQCGALPG